MNRPTNLMTNLKTLLAKNARRVRNGLAFRKRWGSMAGRLNRWGQRPHRLSLPAFGVTQC